MRLFFALILLSLLPFNLYASDTSEFTGTDGLNLTIQHQWQIQATPIAFVQSLDNKKTFILGSDATVYILTTEGKLLGTLPVSEDVIDIDIAPRGETLYLLNKSDKSFTALALSFTYNIDTKTAPFLGNPDAPVTLVEFSDFECPYCAKVKPLLDQLLKANPETLKIAFKHLPLRMHKQAEPAARASIAAQKQGKFWQMHDELFKIKKMTPKAIEAAAQNIGLDMEQFNKDKDSYATKQQLAKDMSDAAQAEVTGTPTMFINGVRVDKRSGDSIQTMIDKALEKEAQK